MSFQSNAGASLVEGLFKKVYGNLTDLVPQSKKFQEKIKFESRKKVGEAYVEAVILGSECGITLMGSTPDVLAINDSVAGAVKQASIKDYAMLLGSVIPFQTISRAAQEGEAAFKAATKHVVKNNLQSHHKFLEIFMVHGQAPYLLGRIERTTCKVRGVSLTTGTGTIESIAFTKGLNTANKAILLGKDFAAGIWTGLDSGAHVKVVSATTKTIAHADLDGVVTAVNADGAFIKVDFALTNVPDLDGYVVCLEGQESSLEMPGISKIIQNTGSLFGIDAATYPLWKGTTHNAGKAKLTFSIIESAIAKAINKGGLDGDVCVFVNPYSWINLLDEMMAKRMFDQSYNSKEMENGTQSIKFFGQAGAVEIVPSTIVKENEAYVLYLDSWSRFGSADVGFKVPGMGEELIQQMPGHTGFAFKSYSSQCVFCNQPAKNVYIADIDNEAT